MFCTFVSVRGINDYREDGSSAITLLLCTIRLATSFKRQTGDVVFQAKTTHRLPSPQNLSPWAEKLMKKIRLT